MSDVVERAKAALEGVTDGPWALEITPPEKDDHDYVWGPGKAQMLWAMDRVGGEVADGKLMVEARSLVPELIAEVERLRWQLRHSDGDHMCDECWPDDEEG